MIYSWEISEVWGLQGGVSRNLAKGSSDFNHFSAKIWYFRHFWDPGRANFAPTPNFSGGSSLTNIFPGDHLAHLLVVCFFRHYWDPGEGAKFWPHPWLFCKGGIFCKYFSQGDTCPPPSFTESKFVILGLMLELMGHFFSYTESEFAISRLMLGINGSHYQ